MIQTIVIIQNRFAEPPLRFFFPYHDDSVLHGGGKDLSGAPRIKLHWIGKKGEDIETDGIVGETILEAAHRHEIELEGACVWGWVDGWFWFVLDQVEW